MDGHRVLVDVVVAGPAGGDATAVAQRALRAQGAVPFGSADLGTGGFTLTGLEWGTLPVIQNYNVAGEPATLGGTGLGDMLNAHLTWNAIGATSNLLRFGEATNRCPSLVDECAVFLRARSLSDEGRVAARDFLRSIRLRDRERRERKGPSGSA
jgi:hypothetical protein